MARLYWFHDFLPTEEGRKCLTEMEVHDLIEMYLVRNEVEVEDLHANDRVGRSTKPKADLLEASIKAEVAEYATGFELPDLTSKRVYEQFGRWNGDLNGITELPKRKFRRRQPAPAAAATDSSSSVITTTTITTEGNGHNDTGGILEDHVPRETIQ